MSKVAVVAATASVAAGTAVTLDGHRSAPHHRTPPALRIASISAPRATPVAAQQQQQARPRVVSAPVHRMRSGVVPVAPAPSSTPQEPVVSTAAPIPAVPVKTATTTTTTTTSQVVETTTTVVDTAAGTVDNVAQTVGNAVPAAAPVTGAVSQVVDGAAQTVSGTVNQVTGAAQPPTTTVVSTVTSLLPGH